MLSERLLCARDCPGIAVSALTLIHSFYSSSLQQVYHSLCPTKLLTHPNPCSQKAVCYVKENKAIRTLCLSPLPKPCMLNPSVASLLYCLPAGSEERMVRTEEGHLITTILDSIHTSLSPIYPNTPPSTGCFLSTSKCDGPQPC